MKFDLALASFEDRCRPYSAIEYTPDFLRHIIRSSVRLSHTEYLAQVDYAYVGSSWVARSSFATPTFHSAWPSL